MSTNFFFFLLFVLLYIFFNIDVFNLTRLSMRESYHQEYQISESKFLRYNSARSTECNCTDMGSEDNVCHNSTGQCKCWPNVDGLTCGQCEANAFNYTSGRGCTKCNCHPQGAILQQCNEVIAYFTEIVDLKMQTVCNEVFTMVTSKDERTLID